MNRLMLTASIVTVAAVALAYQITLPQISSFFQFVGDGTGENDFAKNAVILGTVLIIFTTIINAIGVKLMAQINSSGVFIELIAAVLLIVAFAVNITRGPDVVTETQAAGLSEIRMSRHVLDATLAMRAFLFDAVYENEIATAEFKKAAAILGGLWERVRERPAELLDQRILDTEGLDVAAKDFLAGMTDRFAVALYERLFIPKPWVGPMAWSQL